MKRHIIFFILFQCVSWGLFFNSEIFNAPEKNDERDAKKEAEDLSAHKESLASHYEPNSYSTNFRFVQNTLIPYANEHGATPKAPIVLK